MEKAPSLPAELDALVEPTSAAAPDSPLRRTSKRLRKLSGQLQAMGHHVSYAVVGPLLHQQGYTLQTNRKTREGTSHPAREAQFQYLKFQYLNEQVRMQQTRGEPALWLDTKKKELLGDFKNGGRQWRPKGKPEEVRVHDFVLPEQGKAIPYGVYDLGRNEGWVSLGIDHDRASFAVHALGSCAGALVAGNGAVALSEGDLLADQRLQRGQ